MHLTNYERETIITYNEADKTAQVYTCSRPLIRKLDELRADSGDISMVREDDYSKTYELPKKWVRVQRPPKLTDEQRKKMSERSKARYNAGLMKI